MPTVASSSRVDAAWRVLANVPDPEVPAISVCESALESASSAAGRLSEDLRELAADLGPEHFELILAHWPL